MEKFQLVPQSILEMKDLSDRGFRVYCKLRKFAFDNITCFPSVQLIAKESGKSVDTVKRATKELRELGLIRVYKKEDAKNNIYIFVPIEWIPTEKVTESSQYIDSEQDYQDYVQAIREHYESLGEACIFAKAEKVIAKTKKGTSHVSALKNVKTKIEKGDFTFTDRELCVLFEYAQKELREHSCNINWGRDMSAIKTAFGIKEQYGELEARMILTYVGMYDNVFKASKYPHPTLWGLSREWIFNKVKPLVEKDMRESRVENAVIVEEEF